MLMKEKKSGPLCSFQANPVADVGSSGDALSKTVGIVQARTGSARLPGKILTPILRGIPTIDLLWSRINRVEIPWWLATTDRTEDDELSERAAMLGFQVLRGDTDDVLSRYEKIAGMSGASTIVKVNGDNPTTGAEAIRAMISEASHLGVTKFMLADTGLTRHHPLGHLPQILSREALEGIRYLIPEGADFHRTHVTSILLGQHTTQTQIELGPKASGLRWTVDRFIDIQTVRGLFRSLDVPFQTATYRDFLRAMSQNPSENNLNQNERQHEIEKG